MTCLISSCTCCEESLEQDMREEHDMESLSGSLLKESTDYQDQVDQEKELMKTITDVESNFEAIKRKITPWALTKCCSNSLLMSMKVNLELRRLAEKVGPDVEKFRQLANSVEEFTYRLLDPLKSRQCDSDRRNLLWCKQFGDYALDEILDDAIHQQQKRFFTHPAVHSEMNRKWRGRKFIQFQWKSWQLILFNIWCVFDVVFSPILLAVSLPTKKRRVSGVYLAYLESPYYKFVRDTLSYIILLALHYALCLTSPTIALSGLEWTIFVFFVGRYLVEIKQICNIKRRLKKCQESGDGVVHSSFRKVFSTYISDYWNKLDLINLSVYFTIFILRVVTWVVDGTVANNWLLLAAGYLYSFNTLCLTLRAFGHVMEQSKEIGTIQIALLSILKDVTTVFWQFLAAMLAFSIAITKVYMSERSFIENGTREDEIACKSSGISCWLSMFIHLGWSLFGVSEAFDALKSAHFPSVILVRIFYAMFLIMGVILLINMLIALLSDTFQRTKDNAAREWSFKRAMTIQRYNGYDPIPVPLNIVYRILSPFMNDRNEESSQSLNSHVDKFEEKYFAEHGNMFPVTDEKKLDHVLEETERNRQMISQILTTVFESQGKGRGVLPSGPKAWRFDRDVRIEGSLLKVECVGRPEMHFHGAMYGTRFSPEFPHFEVTIIETGQLRRLGIGVVNKEYEIDEMPGNETGSVGYHTDNGKIYQLDSGDKETEGPVMAFRGDRIRCTVLFEREHRRRVSFTLNGRKVILKSGQGHQIFMDCDDDEPLFPYIGMSDDCAVLAKQGSLTGPCVSNRTEEIWRVW